MATTGILERAHHIAGRRKPAGVRQDECGAQGCGVTLGVHQEAAWLSAAHDTRDSIHRAQAHSPLAPEAGQRARGSFLMFSKPPPQKSALYLHGRNASALLTLGCCNIRATRQSSWAFTTRTESLPVSAQRGKGGLLHQMPLFLLGGCH